jgi:hypothetical protein
MLFFDGGLALIAFAVWVFCIIDVITTPDADCRNLPKFVWLMIVILLPDVGSIAWLVAGRTWNSASRGPAYRSAFGPASASVSASTSKARPTNPDDDDEFLASLRSRAEEQRRRAREADQPDEPPSAPSV